MVANIERVLLEIGRGFAFVGREYPMMIGGQEKRADLLFYLIPQHRYFVVEVKMGEFEPADLGRLEGYLASCDLELNGEGDNHAFGLVVCKGRNETLVRYWEPFWSSKIEGVIKWKWITMPKRLGVSVSAMCAMTGDVVGEQWFYTCGSRPLISLSVVPQFNDITHVVFAWWYEWDECMQQFSDMLDRATTESVMSLLNYIVFTKIDDYCLSPKLWNGLSERERFAVQDFLRLDWYQKDKCKLPLIISRDWAKAG